MEASFAPEINSDLNFMVDIESLGGIPDGVVTSIGALRFNAITGETFEEFKVNIKVQSCLDLGMKIDESTLLFWFDQPKEAQDAMLVDPVPAKEAISQFNKWATDIPNSKDGFWWANGTNYDFTLLQNIFKCCGRTWMPWHYKNIVDLRTERRVMDYKIPDKYFDQGTNHDALDDCRRQVLMVKDILEKRISQ